jgi:hypothetical protein
VHTVLSSEKASTSKPIRTGGRAGCTTISGAYVGSMSLSVSGRLSGGATDLVSGVEILHNSFLLEAPVFQPRHTFSFRFWTNGSFLSSTIIQSAEVQVLQRLESPSVGFWWKIVRIESARRYLSCDMRFFMR